MEFDSDTVEGPTEPAVEPGRGDRGASLVEYALLLSLILIVCLGAISALGGNNKAGLTHSQSCVTAAMDGVSPNC